MNVLKRQDRWETLYFYRKTVVLYQFTIVFCRRFLPPYGDRTVDQMVQAARSGKQNIVEGMSDGITSTEMQLKLLNVARASIQELREDYCDYLKAKQLQQWGQGHSRYDGLLAFCKSNNDLEQYETFFEKWNDEECCNCAITLCHMVDAMINSYLKVLEKDFVENGGIKERMYAARTGYRQGIDDRLKQLEAENARLKQLLKQHGIEF
ncbi:MAG: four helix bundle suffix domain-containing protein [Bacteroidales bacterium]|nr:four helix bundle suffix domain-containing protein [Candidatus Sodaliphilus limicaballi]